MCAFCQSVVQADYDDLRDLAVDVMRVCRGEHGVCGHAAALVATVIANRDAVRQRTRRLLCLHSVSVGSVLFRRRARGKKGSRVGHSVREGRNVVINIHLFIMVITQLEGNLLVSIVASVSVGPASLAGCGDGLRMRRVLAVAMRCASHLFADGEVSVLRAGSHLDIVVNQDRLRRRALFSDLSNHGGQSQANVSARRLASQTGSLRRHGRRRAANGDR